MRASSPRAWRQATEQNLASATPDHPATISAIATISATSAMKAANSGTPDCDRAIEHGLPGPTLCASFSGDLEQLLACISNWRRLQASLN